ncbi:MAG: hypothetical protein FWF44_01205 [Defluviitaleaceae bacterium]|nr:hypothetical protein [Defluviitaleaceae bacterium]
MKYKDGDDEFFRKLAAQYVESEGEKLNRELEDAENAPFPDNAVKMERRVKSGVRAAKVRKALYTVIPVAACFLVVIIGIYWFYSSSSNSNSPLAQGNAEPTPAAASTVSNSTATPAQTSDNRVEIAFLSEKLPEGCELTGTDYDHDKTIYHIRSASDDNVILVAEPYTEEPPTDGFIPTTINGLDAYVMNRTDYKVLWVRDGGALYTFTSEFSVQDMIDIAAAVI